MAISLSNISAYTQNFDSLVNTGSSSILPAEWLIAESGTAANLIYTAGTGSANTGDTYSFGATGNTERALGSLQSGSLIPSFGVSFTNNTDSTISALNIAYTGERWRVGTINRIDQLDFQLSTDATSLTNGTWTDYNTLDFALISGATTGALDGNLTANRAAISNSITGLSLANGSNFWIRWNDLNASGADDGLAVDDFSLTPVLATVTPGLSITQSGGNTSVAEGGATDTYDIVLNTQPTGNVTVNITAPGGQINLFAPSLTFTSTNWNVPQAVTVSAVDDTVVEGSHSANISHTVASSDSSYNGIIAPGVTVAIADNDIAPPTITKIHAIQGSGTAFDPTFGGNRTIEGIVTRAFTGSTRLNGFYVQEEDADADGNTATSEAIFVFDTSGTVVNSGDKVRVTGNVIEFTSGTSSLTELDTAGVSANIVNLSAGNLLPTTTNIQLPVVATTDLERYEGMLVNVSAATGGLTVTENFQLGRFGQVLLAVDGASNQPGTDARLDQFTQFNAPSVAGNTAYQAELAKRRIYLDDGSGSSNLDPTIFGRGGNPLSASNTLRSGDTVANITGILDQRFEGYRIQTSTGVNFTAANPRPTVTPAVGGTLKVASFNVLNYFNTVGASTATFTNDAGQSLTLRGANNAAEFTRQRDKTIQAIITSGADVIGLNEVQNNGFGANSAIQDLVNGLNAVAGAGTYAFVDRPGAGITLSTDAITVGMIYKPGAVTPVGSSATMALGYSADFDLVGRRPLAQTFQQVSNGQQFTAVINHFKSKGSSSGGIGDADAGDGQGFSNGTRTRQSQALEAWLRTNPTGTSDPDVIILGDLNAYAQEDPLTALTTTGYTNLLPNTSYSYVFNGQVGSLDHALGNSSLAAQVIGAEKWHINADEPTSLDYNTEFKSVGHQTSLYSADQFRSSDHDPIVVGLNLQSNKARVSNYDFTNLPKLGTTSNGQDILLGGFSGLYFQGLAANGNLKFVTHTDRGPNGEPTGANRPFFLPSFQPEIISFELNRLTGKIEITKRTGLFRADGTTPLTGLPNLQAQANGLAYTDEVGVDLTGKILPNDPFGADVEGIAVAANGDYWMVDEYRPAIYHFDIKGKLLDRFIPQGTATAPEPDQAAGTFGKEVLPAVYAQRRSNRGFEAVALDGDKLYAFIQSPIDNPDNAGDTASRASRNLRILEFNTVSKTVTGEYVYLLDNITGSGNARTDKLGDAVALGNGKFALVERDDLATDASNKLIYQIDLAGATNINNPANFTLPTGKTIEQLTPAELTTAKITPVSKSLIANAAKLGYTGVEKLEGLALVAPNTLALINDNDFNVAGGNVPERLGILELDKDLPVAKPAFPNGVASGDTTQNSTVLWTRANTLGKVTFEYSTKADFSSIAGTKTATVTDALQPVKVNVDGLTANTDYFYRVTDANGAKINGKFSTSAAVGTRTGLKFGASGDWRGELAPYPAVSNADTANLEFFIGLGDTIYGDVASPAVRNPDGSEKSQATTLAEYRAKNAEVYGSSYGQNTLGDLRANTSFLATIDDHEVTNDFSGGKDLATVDAATQTLFGAKTGLVNDSPLFDNGMQAFQEFNPLQDLTYSTPGDARTDGERKLYRANTFGSDAATFILDTRSFRDTELPGVTNLSDQAQVGKFLTDSFDPKRTMLGKQQIVDLKRDLLQAQKDGVTWKFITVPEPIQNIGVLAASDRFEGYAAERTEILKFINDNKISNVVFVAADIHGTLVNNLTYQVAPGQAQIATSAFEITTGSVAYSQPFGQTVAQLGATLGVITAAQKAVYDSLPTTGKDAFIKGVVDGGLNPLGYDPLGLDKNLTQANGLINAKLLQGDYVATHVYGWTEFNIDQKTQKLTVTTYGIDPYTRAELEANPSAITSRQPKVVSQFEVSPNDLEPQKVAGTTGADKLEAGITPGFSGYNNVVFTGAGNDTVDVPTGGLDSGKNRIDTGSGNDLIFIADADRAFGSAGNDEFEARDARDYRASGGAGNDIFYLGTNGRALGGEGNDEFFVSNGGGNLLTGGAGVDQFWIANGDLPASVNTILDFQIGTDVIGIQGIGANATNIVLAQVGADASIGFGGQTLALLKGIQASSLTPSNPGQFVFA